MARIRHATIKDLRAVVALGIEALENDPLPNMVISRNRVEECATAVLNDAGSYCAVVEDDDGKIVGALAALVHDNIFYERRQASVLQVYCKKSPWGIRLIKHFLEWTAKRPIIKMVTFTLEVDTDNDRWQRVAQLLEHMGFKAELPVYVRYRNV